MKFRSERDLLVEVLSTAARAVSSRGSALPVLSGIHLALESNSLVVTGSDLDLTISMGIEVSGSSPGVAVVPAKLVTEIVKAMPQGAIELEVDGEEARISAGRSQFAVNTIPPQEFPRQQALDGEPITIDAKAFTEALRQVVPAASLEDSRPILTGVLLAAEGDGLRLVATDSYRLAVRDLPGTSVLEQGQSVLVPSTALRELTRLLGAADEIEVRLGEREASFGIGSATLTTRLLEGEFPRYQNLIPASQPNSLTVGREPLLDSVRRVRLVASSPSTPVRLEMRGDGVDLWVNEMDRGQAHETIDATLEGNELTVAFNPDYLIAGIEAAGTEEITIETSDPMKPAVIRSPDNPDFLYLLMPVRVS